jgi:hypothetical protein
MQPEPSTLPDNVQKYIGEDLPEDHDPWGEPGNTDVIEEDPEDDDRDPSA